MTCTRCDSSGFLNIDQVPAAIASGGVETVLAWMAAQTEPHDVSVCDCCGNTEVWYGTPGAHYEDGDNAGMGGHYAYNGGLPECS